jgi:hypothetical protein
VAGEVIDPGETGVRRLGLPGVSRLAPNARMGGSVPFRHLPADARKGRVGDEGGGVKPDNLVGRVVWFWSGTTFVAPPAGIRPSTRRRYYRRRR